MYAYELLPRLVYLTLSADNSQEYWEEKLEFIGTKIQWDLSEKMEMELCQ